MAKPSAAIITIDTTELEVQSWLRELCLLFKVQKVLTDKLRAYVREHGPVEGHGLFVDNRQCVYQEVPKPDLLAEVIVSLTETDGFTALIRRLLQAMPITTYNSFIKKSGELGEWMKALMEMDQDNGCYIHYGDATIDVRKSPADDSKHHVVMPGEKALGSGN